MLCSVHSAASSTLTAVCLGTGSPPTLQKHMTTCTLQAGSLAEPIKQPVETQTSEKLRTESHTPLLLPTDA